MRIARASSIAAVVLAAGAGARYGPEPGAKLRAGLDGRPILEHVLRALRAFGPAATIVVVGHGAEALERAIPWTGEIRVRNRQPDRGLASSLRVGFEALEMLPTTGTIGSAFIVLGDQPRLDPVVLRALADAIPRARATGRSVIVSTYGAVPGPRNPVLLLRPAWELVRQPNGDRGLGALIEARPGLVLDVPVPGAMPDVDTPEDLERLRQPRPGAS